MEEEERTTGEHRGRPASSAAAGRQRRLRIHAPPSANGNKFAFLTLQLRTARGADETGAGMEQATGGQIRPGDAHGELSAELDDKYP